MTQKMLSLASIFTIEARDYVHFSIDAATLATVRNVILGFCIGILLASLYMLYQKLVPGAIVRAILRAEAHTSETAKTLGELGLDKNPLYRFELRRNAMLNKLILRASVQEPTESEAATESEAKGEGSTASEREAAEGAVTEERFYITEEAKYRAELRFDKKGNGVVGLVLTALLTVVLAILLIKLTPVVLGMVDNLLK